MTATNSALPLPLQSALNQLPAFIKSLAKSRPGLIRTMRPERQESLKKFLTAMLLSCSLQHDGAICYLNKDWTKPKTLQELANQAGITITRAKRCLGELTARSYVTSKQIRRKNGSNGQLEVSPGLRFFTKKFWDALGLWSVFKQSVGWAKKHCKRRLLMPFKAISNKAKSEFSTAREALGSMFRAFTPEDQSRGKEWCSKILQGLRQNE